MGRGEPKQASEKSEGRACADPGGGEIDLPKPYLRADNNYEPEDEVLLV